MGVASWPSRRGLALFGVTVMWMGGPTEFAKVVAIAQAQGVAVVPHGCGVYGYYMAMAFLTYRF